jgi:hypothetical protein
VTDLKLSLPADGKLMLRYSVAFLPAIEYSQRLEFDDITFPPPAAFAGAQAAH